MTETFGSDLPTGRDEEVVLQVAETTGTCKVLRHCAPLEGNLGQTVTAPNSAVEGNLGQTVTSSNSAVEENLNPGDSTWNYGGGSNLMHGAVQWNAERIQESRQSPQLKGVERTTCRVDV